MDLIKALRVVALRDVLTDSPELQLRQVFRWYARTYGITPLEAERLPIVHLLQEFFEDKYGHMSPEDRETERLELLETNEQRLLRLAEEEERVNTDAAFEAMTMEMIEKQKREEAIAAKNQPLTKPKPPPVKTLPEVGLEGKGTQILSSGAQQILPNIKMKFETPEVFEELLEQGFGQND